MGIWLVQRTITYTLIDCTAIYLNVYYVLFDNRVDHLKLTDLQSCAHPESTHWFLCTSLKKHSLRLATTIVL